MRRKAWLVVPWLVLLTGLLGVVGCNIQSDPYSCQVDADCMSPQQCVEGQCLAEGDRDIEVADNVRWLEKHAGFRSVDVEPDRLVFTFDGPAASYDVEEGYMVVGKGMDGHTGYLRHVERKMVDGSVMILETTPASLFEAVSGEWTRRFSLHDGELVYFESPIGLTLNDVHLAPTEAGDGLRQLEQPAYSGRVNLAGRELFSERFEVSCGGDNCVAGSCQCNASPDCPSGYQCDQADCDPDNEIDDEKYKGVCRLIGQSTAFVEIKLEFVEPSYVQLDPEFEITTKSSWLGFGGLKKFKIAAGADFETNINVKASAEAGASYSNEVELLTLSKDIWFALGWLPVNVQIEFKFIGGYSLELAVGGAVTTGFDVSADLSIGAEWRSEWDDGAEDEWRPFATRNWQKNFHEPQWEAHGEVTARVWLKPVVAFKLYHQVGPEIVVQPRLNATFHFLPKVCWEVWVDIMAELNLRFGFFEDLGLGPVGWTMVDNRPEGQGRDADAWFLFDPWWLYNNCSCEPEHDHQVCYDDKVHWADACDEVDESAAGLVEDCPAQGQKCVDAQCVPDGFGDLAGLIKDAQTEEPIEGATIEIYQRDDLIDTLTSGADGRYSKTHLAVGSYTLQIEKEGYLPATVVVNILDGEVTEVTPLRKLPEDCTGNGTASGQIVNAVTGEGVPAHIEFRAGVDVKEGDVVGEADADGDGFYTVELPSGNYTGEVNYSNFATGWFDIVVCGPGDWPEQNAAISPLDDGNWRIVLTWGENPPDLDLHCVTPAIEGQQHHIFYRAACRGSRDEAPYADLDVDDRNSFGPETVTIADLRSGDYTFHVHNYGGENEDEPGTLAGSYARVQVYNPEGFRVRAFNVSAGGFWWHAFTLTGPDGDVSQGGSCPNAACTNPADFDPPACFPQ